MAQPRAVSGVLNTGIHQARFGPHKPPEDAMRTKLMIATAAAAALLAGAAYAQSDTAVNPTTLPDGE